MASALLLSLFSSFFFFFPRSYSKLTDMGVLPRILYLYSNPPPRKKKDIQKWDIKHRHGFIYIYICVGEQQQNNHPIVAEAKRERGGRSYDISIE